MTFVGKADNEQFNKLLFGVAETFSTSKIIELYETLLIGVKNLSTLAYIVEYLSKRHTNMFKYQKYQISVKLFECLSQVECRNLWHLITRPLLIIEQYLMNSRFETLAKMLKAIKPLLAHELCDLCREPTDDSFNNVSNLMRLIDISRSGSSDYIMVNYDANHTEEKISEECIDALLRTYAAKALEFRISERQSLASYSFLSRISLELKTYSGQFVMPKEPPTKDNWTNDDDASACMCCKKSVFTLLTRRHHCRRCGRVVCHNCSMRKIRIPELYSDIQVRCCNDCYYTIDSEKERSSLAPSTCSEDFAEQWTFTGNTKHDNLVRDEFSYEYAPSVNLCLSVCDLFSTDAKCYTFLLDQARRVEALFRPLQPGQPNPEMDYELVAKMVHCLALAAKVRGASGECNDFIDHAQLVLALLNYGCESLIPMEPLQSIGLRKLRDALIKAEQWSLALEISLKYQFPTVGVLASWGIVCLKAGCYNTAREKFQHCMKPIENPDPPQNLMNVLTSDVQINAKMLKDLVQKKRPSNSPGLLTEILNILEKSVVVNVYENPAVRTPLQAITKLFKGQEVVDTNEVASNTVQRLENLKNIAQGVFYDVVPERKLYREARELDNTSKAFIYESQLISSRAYEEALFYLNSYGSHTDILDFLVRHFQIVAALKYLLLQKLDPEIFIHYIYYPCLRQKNVVVIFEYMTKVDETLMMFKKYVLQLCHHLERKQNWKELYDIQVLIRDPIRASMTCVKFYTMGAQSYTDFQARKSHLLKAQKHLEEEFELASKWEDIKDLQKNYKNDDSSLVMKKGVKTLSNFLNTLAGQVEVTTFLANCEAKKINVCGSIPDMCESYSSRTPPTLFEDGQSKLLLSVLVLVHGENVDAGFGLSYR